MALNVNAAFAEFQKNLIDLDKDRTTKARSSRDWLWGQLESLPEKITDFPQLYKGMHLNYGSFARNTKIRELDDIDMMLTLTGSGGSYHQEGNVYSISMPEAATRLWPLSDSGVLNSKKVVNKLVAELKEIEHYKQADIHRNQEAATLKLSSYEWNFDIVPAFYTTTGFYLIPDGDGNWQATDTRKDTAKVAEAVEKHGKIVLQTIRTLKYWNRRAKVVTISSYLFENMILNYFISRDTGAEFVDVELVNFWDALQTRIYYPVNDPKGFQGDLNTLSSDDRISIAAKAKNAATIGLEAIKFDNNGEQQKAINKWREIFGPEFPSYE